MIITHGDIGHVTPIPYKHMDPIVHVLDAVILVPTAVLVSGVGKGPVIRLLGD